MKKWFQKLLEIFLKHIEEEKDPETPKPPEDPETPKPPEDGEFPVGLKWLHPDVSGWQVTSRLKSVQVTGNRITLNYDRAKVWPAREEAGATVNANPWIIAEIDGKWYAGTWEWMRYGQTTKNRVARGDHVKRPPMSGSWEPKSGDRVGFMVSGLIRGRTRNVSERTNLVWITWP
jgi:hypothetical protein